MNFRKGLIVLSAVLVGNLNSINLGGLQINGILGIQNNEIQETKDRMAGSKRENLEKLFSNFSEGIQSFLKRKCGCSNLKLLQLLGRSVRNFPDAVSELSKNERTEFKKITEYMLNPIRCKNPTFLENLLKCDPKTVKNVLSVLSDQYKMDKIDDFAAFDVKNCGRGYSVLNWILDDSPSEDLKTICNFSYATKMFARNQDLEKRTTRLSWLAALSSIALVSTIGTFALFSSGSH